MTLARCDGESCCARWQELCVAYDEGRCEEVAIEVKRMLDESIFLSCKLAPRLLHALKRDGWREDREDG